MRRLHKYFGYISKFKTIEFRYIAIYFKKSCVVYNLILPRAPKVTKISL